MNTSEADQVLSILSSPHAWDLDVEQRGVWFQAALAGIDLDLGLDVAVRLVETEERFPTPARFNAERATVERERYEARRAAERESGHQQSIPPVPITREERAEWIAEMRRMLAPLGRGGTRGHDHKGPKPCPVCGGIAPGVLAAMSLDEQDEVALLRQQHADRHRVRG